jgi:hypothetical protein
MMLIIKSEKEWQTILDVYPQKYTSHFLTYKPKLWHEGPHSYRGCGIYLIAKTLSNFAAEFTSSHDGTIQ